MRVQKLTQRINKNLKWFYKDQEFELLKDAAEFAGCTTLEFRKRATVVQSRPDYKAFDVENNCWFEKEKYFKTEEDLIDISTFSIVEKRKLNDFFNSNKCSVDDVKFFIKKMQLK